jgi:hypothetical protein
MTCCNTNGATSNRYNNLVIKPNREGLFEKLRIDGRMILKCLSQENECG